VKVVFLTLDEAIALHADQIEWSQPWQDEIKRMLASGLKYARDALANKDFRHLTKT
jgi:hypothetical protein